MQLENLFYILLIYNYLDNIPETILQFTVAHNNLFNETRDHKYTKSCEK